MTMMHSIEAAQINISKTAFYTHGRTAVKVDRVLSVQERQADEIGKRPPYAYTSACPDKRWRI